MTLANSTQFNSYLIGEPIGAGGMGEVYRATDTRLKRDVAIKVLPESFAADAERLARFQREAELLASLNHPNIAQIHGLETADGITALIMELIEGPTLADRIEQGPIPPDESIGIALQIAAALEAAHGRGIIHRDLKPANIKLRPDGTVKVLDFGIAKALDASTGNSGPHSPAMTTPAMTMAGIILGTAAYMSPEQARGKTVDERADIWAFGCVLYEMLTGQPVFGGEDVTITLARVLERELDLGALPATLSPAVRHTLKLCLRKDPKKRIRHISDVRLALEGEFESGLAPAAVAPVARRWQRKLLLAGTVATALLVGGIGVYVNMQPQPLPLNRFAYTIPADLPFRNVGRNVLAFSPDGRHFVYNTNQGLFLRTLGELEARLIPGTEEGLLNPFFSPDGKTVAYEASGQLKRIAINGGAPVVVTRVETSLNGASWGPGDTILFAQNTGIYRVSANGGTPELVIPRQGLEQFGSPEMLPDGATVLFSIRTESTWNQAQIVAQSLATGERSVLVQGGSNAHYLPSGHLVYALGDGLVAVAFDLDTLAVRGAAVPLAQDIIRASATDSANYGISADGTLAYASGATAAARRSLVWIDRDGSEQLINAPLRAYDYAQLSPDGTRVALDSRDEENDIWIFDLTREILQRLTFDQGIDRAPVWSPDGRRVAFSSEMGGRPQPYWQAADGSGTAELLADISVASGDNFFPSSFTPDGSALLSTAGTGDIWITMIDGTTTNSSPLIESEGGLNGAAVSPDGRWLAYQSPESGKFEIYVRPFPDVDTGRWQVSTNGGTHPEWSADGSELFYLDMDGNASIGTGAMMAVPIAAETDFTPGTPVQLFAGNFLAPNLQRLVYDVTNDGQRFLMIRQAGSAGDARREIILVQNFLAELQRLVPVD